MMLVIFSKILKGMFNFWTYCSLIFLSYLVHVQFCSIQNVWHPFFLDGIWRVHAIVPKHAMIIFTYKKIYRYIKRVNRVFNAYTLVYFISRNGWYGFCTTRIYRWNKTRISAINKYNFRGNWCTRYGNTNLSNIILSCWFRWRCWINIWTKYYGKSFNMLKITFFSIFNISEYSETP